MARARNIKPGFFRNADLAELGIETRLLFIGLWLLADREGRLLDRPKQIKMELYPADEIDVDKCLDGLQSKGLIVRYQSHGKNCIEITNFKKHQHPHCKEPCSELPSPCESGARPVQAQCKPGASTVQTGLIPDVLIPDVLIPDSDSLRSSGKTEKPDVPPSASPKRGTRIPDGWTVPGDWISWAMSEAPGWRKDRVDRMAAKFCDHFRSVPGQRGVKTDWKATWRNWVRSEIDRDPQAIQSAKVRDEKGRVHGASVGFKGYIE